MNVNTNMYTASPLLKLLKLFLNVIITNCGFSGFCLYAKNIVYIRTTNLLFFIGFVWFICSSIQSHM
jgi:hypothetical protein